MLFASRAFVRRYTVRVIKVKSARAMEIQEDGDIPEVKVGSATTPTAARRSPIALLKSVCVIVVLVLYILQGGVVLMGIEGTVQEI